MHRRIAMCLVAVLATLSAAQAAAQAPPGPQDAGDGVEADGGLLIDRIDPERLRQIRTERNRQYILGLGLLAASGAVGFSKQNWVVDEGATLAQTRLRNGAAAMAVPAGVLAANAPGRRRRTMFVSRDLSLGFRRGWTHGVGCWPTRAGPLAGAGQPLLD